MFNFGGGGNTGGGFGAPTNTGGGFGTTQPQNTGFAFGSSGAQGAGFGATNTGGGFGTTQTQPQNTGFGFGTQPQNTNTGGVGGGFGMQPNTNTGFGQAKPFGTTGATSTGFSFGSQPNTQQPQGNTFGASNNPFGGTSTTGGFGGQPTTTNTFGSTTTGTTQNTGFSFGSQPTTGTTGFGATQGSNPFGGTTGATQGAFGSTQPTTGFSFGGGNQPTTNTGGGLFGNQPTTNTGMGFGNANPTMGMGNTGGPITPQSFPSFKPTEENNTSTNSKMLYYSITKMDPYKDKSFEEWRWLFTLASQGKLTQNPFSTPSTTTTTGTVPFGTTQTQPTSGFSFGNNTGTTTNTGFGATTGTGTGFGFGAQPQPQTTGAFGATTNTGFGATTNTGFGATSTFGTANKPATNGFSFGSQPTTTGTTGGLGFGTTQTQPTSSFSFGGGGTTNTGTTGFGSTQPSGTSSFNFGGGPTTMAPTTTAGTSGFNFGGSTQPQTTGTTNTGSGFNFGGSTQPSTSSGFNFGTGQSGGFGTQPGGGMGTTTAPTSSGFNFGGGMGTTATAPTSSGFNFGGGNTGTANTGSSGFNFGSTAQPLGGTAGSGFNFGSNTNTGLGMSTGFAQPNQTGYGVAPMTLPDLNNLLADPFGNNPLFQLQKEALESYVHEEESSVISKSIQKTSTQVRPRTFKKSSNNTLVDRMSLIAYDTEPVKPLEDLLDSSSFTSKENVKELTISSAAFDKRSSQKFNQPNTNGLAQTIDDSKTINSNAIRPKPQKGKSIALDNEEIPKETTLKPTYLPKLTKEGYFTKPSFDQMKQMSQFELQNCNGFTVGRKGYGKVEFLGITDLTRNLDLDKIIYEIETHHVEVYSTNDYTEKTKPTVGTELNKPTIIKLFNVHPKNNDYKQFEKKLRKANEKSGSKFIDYVNGQWTFKVEHFTKYGIDDEEEEEEEEEPIQDKEEEKPFQVVKTINLDEISDDEDELVEEEIESSGENDEQDLVDNMQIESHRTFLPRQLNLDPRRMYIMQANLMNDDDDDGTDNFETIRKTKKPRFKEVSESEPTLAFVKKTGQQVIKPRKYIDSTPSNIVGDPQSESSSRDMLFGLSRSFRVGFLPNGQFIVPSIVFNSKSKLSNVSISEFYVKEDHKVPPEEEEEYLKLKYETKIHLEIEHVEKAALDLKISLRENSLTTIMHQHAQKCEKIINSIDHYRFSEQTKKIIHNRESFELSVWKLVHILFGEVDMFDGNDYATDMARKRNLSAWIREQIPIDEIMMNNSERRTPIKPLERVYLLLSCGRIAEAAKVALDNSDIRLSSIISQSFSNPFMQKDIQKQISLWKQAKANIDLDLIKIYELLAGNVSDTSLSWLECLGLHLWYKSSPDTSIGQVFASYTNYFETHRSTKPFLRSARHCSDTHYDLRYQILALYCRRGEQSITSSLEPFTYIDDILDCQLTFHLYNVLKRLIVNNSNHSMSHIIACNYALQLEQCGYWQYALFILCHCDVIPTLSDDTMRELHSSQDGSNNPISKFHRDRLVHVRDGAIRELLFRNYPSLLSSKKMEFITQTLHISMNWIYQAAAQYARYTCSYDLLFENLYCYGNFQQAHKVFLEYILSDLLLMNRYEEMVKYIQKLYDHQVDIPDWSHGGDILYRYICVRKQFETLESHIEGNASIFTESTRIETTYHALIKLDGQITDLLDLIKHLHVNQTLEHYVAISDMTVKITNMMVKVKSLLTIYENDTQYNNNTIIHSDHTQQYNTQKEECLSNMASVSQNVYLTNQIDLLQTLALSSTFTLQ